MMGLREEFTDDLMMKELHAIREKIYEETKHMDPQQAIQYRWEKTKRTLDEMGYLVIECKDGTSRIMKKRYGITVPTAGAPQG